MTFLLSTLRCLPAILATVVLVFSSTAAKAERLPYLPEMHPALIVKNRVMSKTRQTLVAERKILYARNVRLLATCKGVAAGSAEDARCAAEDQSLQKALEDHHDASIDWIDEYLSAYGSYIVTEMKGFARGHGWNATELKALDTHFKAFSERNLSSVSTESVKGAWSSIFARSDDATLKQLAQSTKGFQTTNMGKQSFQDCAVFALANASGRPYSVVATIAAQLIADGKWRTPTERADPAKTIKSQGLNGGEVILLAEHLGTAKVIERAAFGSMLTKGYPVMVNLVPSSGSFHEGHQIVLTKTFTQGSTTWFEAIDSNQGENRKIYMNDGELNVLLKESGIAFIAKPSFSPSLERSRD